MRFLLVKSHPGQNWVALLVQYRKGGYLSKEGGEALLDGILRNAWCWAVWCVPENQCATSIAPK